MQMHPEWDRLLHPEKYEACETPIAVDVAALPTLPGFGRPAASRLMARPLPTGPHEAEWFRPGAYLDGY